MKRIAVFCGSSSGLDKGYVSQAFYVGEYLAQKQIGLVYGGAAVGLMGAVADGARSRAGEVIGVIPGFLQTKEIAHEGLTSLITVRSMHERKQRIYDLSEGFIALPGGFGTMDESFEMLTWGQLGMHTKPLGFLNTLGFYNDLLRFMDTMVDHGFLKGVNRQMVLVSETIEGLLDKMEAYRPPAAAKWIKNPGPGAP